jgi:hypothetical protein
MGSNWEGHKADHSPPSNAKVKNGGIIPSLPHVFMAHCLNTGTTLLLTVILCKLLHNMSNIPLRTMDCTTFNCEAKNLFAIKLFSYWGNRLRLRSCSE